MRRLLVRAGLAAVVAMVLWLTTARWWSQAIDQVYTAPVVTLAANPIGWNGSYLQFGNAIPGTIGPAGWSGAAVATGAHVLDLAGPGPDYKPAAQLAVDGQSRLVLTGAAGSFVFGTRSGVLQGGDEPVPAFAAAPGDATSLLLERSLLSWPTPFDFNFMTGHSPSWRRYLYYRLSWAKPSGARLRVTWRLEQGWDGENGWIAPGAAEVIALELRPGSAP